jgi:phosphatidylserine decarboxylase
MLTHLQYFIPQHLLSRIAGKLANSSQPWIKNFLIKRFIKAYPVDMSIAVHENPEDYPTFNEFFIRRLKQNLRPIISGEENIVCPVDGVVSEIGTLNKNQLVQAKNFYFDLETLLGGDKELAQVFYEGNFVTFYLAPKDYHRVHMPLSGQLNKIIYVPGKLFSVNHSTSENIPNLYSRNERVITLFHTKAGPMAVIFVGALLVGSIQMAWMEKSLRDNKIRLITEENAINLNKGAELGYFKMGSTVLILFANKKMKWLSGIKKNLSVKLGQLLGNVL